MVNYPNDNAKLYLRLCELAHLTPAQKKRKWDLYQLSKYPTLEELCRIDVDYQALERSSRWLRSC